MLYYFAWLFLKVSGNILIEMPASLTLTKVTLRTREWLLLRIITDVMGTVGKACVGPYFRKSLWPLSNSYYLMTGNDHEVQVSEMFLGKTVIIFNKYFKTNFIYMLSLFVGLTGLKKIKYSIL